MALLEAKKATVKNKLKLFSMKMVAKGSFKKAMAKVLAKEPAPKVEEQPAVELQAVAVEPAEVEAPVQDSEAQAKCKLQVGDLFRVSHEDHVHKLKYGASGSVFKVIDEHHIEGKLEAGLAVITLPTFLLEKTAGLRKAEPLKNLTRITMSEKRSLLMEIGIDGRSEATVEALKVKDKEAADQHVDLYAAIVRWSFGLLESSKVQYVELILSRLVLEDDLQSPQGPYILQPKDEVVAQKRLRILRKMLSLSEVMVMPVYGQGPRHFTLLVLRKREGGAVEVSYYDSLHVLHGDCLRNAKALCELLAVSAEVLRINTARQTGVDCGFFVCHYLEENIRCFDGQGMATQGWPDLKRVREIREVIAKSATTLEGVREKWAVEETTKAMKVVAWLQGMAEQARKILESKGLMAKLAEAAEKLSKALFNEGAGPDPVPLPEGFGIKVPKKPVEQLEAAIDEKVEAKPADEVEDTSGEQVEVEAPEQVEAGTGQKVEALLAEQLEATSGVKAEAKVAEQMEATSEEKVEVEAAHEMETATGEKVAATLEEKVQHKVEAKAESQEKPLAPKKVQDIEGVFNEDDLAIELAIQHWSVEDLRDEYRLKYEKVKAEGCGVCTKCRWTSGCMNCDADKAWRYYVKQELGMMGVGKAVGKAKAKAKAKPVKGGGSDMTQAPHEVFMSTKC